LAHQSGGHAVAVALKLQMLIDVNANRFEDRKLPALRRQGLQCRRIKLCKRIRAAAWQLLKRPCVEVLQQGRYGRIDFIDSLKALVANLILIKRSTT
jgi:hypothetical protein